MSRIRPSRWRSSSSTRFSPLRRVEKKTSLALSGLPTMDRQREQIMHLGEALSSSIKVENKMVRITVQSNRIVAHDIDLDARFANLHADIAVDKVGRVQVLAEKVRFYCDDLDSIGIDVLVAIDDLLGKDKDYGKAFWKLKKKVERLVATSEKGTKLSR